MRIEARSKLVMIGDSITDCNRARPVGEGWRSQQLGTGYVAMVDALLTATYPERHIRVMNTGLSGNRVRELKARWQSDVLDLQPDWLSIMIGINDVWRQYDQPHQTADHVLLDEYERTLEELVNSTKSRLKGLVLMTPYYIEPNRSDAMRATMDRYGATVKRLAVRHNAIFVDTQATFDRLLEQYYPAALAWDRVHPSWPGHMALARAFLSAVGYVW